MRSSCSTVGTVLTLVCLTLTSTSAIPPSTGMPPALVQVPTDGAPTNATLGVPVYPNAVFLTTYDAGLGQNYYIFGAKSTFEEMVRYYVTVLDDGGDRVFDAPAVHFFQVGRFREKSMAFPPSVTIKDYTWNGSEGYLHPMAVMDERYRTIIQIVPPPSGQSGQ